MTEEIKEIFYKLRSDDYYEKHYQQSVYYEKDLNKLENHITNLQKENKLHDKILKDANDVLNIQAQKGNYNYDSYMLGLYNGMEMIVSLFEQREPKLKSGKDIKFLHETDYKQRNEKAIKYIRDSGISFLNLANQRCFCINNCADKILNILEGGDE